MKRLSWLQALRGIAAMMVLFFHMRPHWETLPWLMPLSAITRWGAVGVDVFITLSGFVVGYSIFNMRPGLQTSATRFLARRAIRIYSGYWIVLAFVVVGTLCLFPGTAFPAQKALRSIFLLYPHLDGWLPVAWTLSFELYFYAWAALALWLRPKDILFWMVSALIFLIVWNYGWMKMAPALVHDAMQPTRFALPAFGIEFLSGALLALDFHRRERVAGYAMCGIVLTCAGAALGTFSYDALHFELLRALCFGTASSGLIMICVWLECEHEWMSPRWLQTIGDASYSLYLLHFFLLDATSLTRAWLNNHEPVLLAPFTLSLPILIIAFSILWYRLLEKPVYRYLCTRLRV